MSSNRRNHPLSSPTRRSYWGQYWILGLVWIACTGCLPFALGQDTLAPSDIEGVKVLVKQAEDLFKEKKFGESAKAIETCNASFVDLVVAGAKKDLPEWERLHRKLARAAEVLAIEGAEFEPLPEWSAVIAKVREMESGKSKPDTKKPGEKKPNEKSIANGISFSKGVAPILVEHCGRCHVDKASGGFAMPDYQGLIKGSKAGVVLFPGDPDSSPLVDAIQSGTMPPNGNKVPADKLAVIKAWVKQGAQ